MGKSLKNVDDVVIRFAGDSGDGMQLTGTRFTETTAIFGNDLSTLPDYPAEIRAPAGSLAGVSVFQLHFSSKNIHTPGDNPDVLVAMNPAALKVHLGDLMPGGAIIANANTFTPKNLQLAGYESNPLEDGSLEGVYEIYAIEMTKMVTDACADMSLSSKLVERTKNMFALGMLYWMYNRTLDSTLAWLRKKFESKPEIVEANSRALKTGYNFGETTEIFTTRYKVGKASLPPGKYRNINGNYAISLGLLAAAQKGNIPLFYGGYPITPASDILHTLAAFRHFGVKTFQAEDEIAGIASAIGASFSGNLGITASSGPGIALKTEALGLAVMTELPLVIVNVQRGGPSTGLPTKTEQSDLFQAVLGRNGDTPMPVVAPKSPGDCFYAAYEACMIAIKYMTPVFVLSDGYLANGSEPWKIPELKDLKNFKVSFQKDLSENENFMPYLRDPETLARGWAIPGTSNFEHRIGGLEKEDITGNVSYDSANHQRMTDLRFAKIARIANEFPPSNIFGNKSGELLIITWGGTYGTGRSAAERCQRENLKVSQLHLRWINPLPKDLGSIIKKFKHVLIPEQNMGQLRMLIRNEFLVDAVGLNQVRGRPIRAGSIVEKVKEILG
ncbi:MAG: 2-oxoacid:acceptor oxidoreductase subunit alpha [Candidatus Neomarinimicrobiota bacterium]